MRAALFDLSQKWNELSTQSNNINWEICPNVEAFLAADADIYINLNDDAANLEYDSINKPLLINSVIHTCSEIKYNGDICRINGWNGFLARPVWEVSGNSSEFYNRFFSEILKQTILVADEPGMISARVLAMIINEAWFALEAGVSSKEEIDIAMKLGTNYPIGPFAWGDRIGLKQIGDLLLRMESEESKYKPCSLLIQTIATT